MLTYPTGNQKTDYPTMHTFHRQNIVRIPTIMDDAHLTKLREEVLALVAERNRINRLNFLVHKQGATIGRDKLEGTKTLDFYRSPELADTLRAIIGSSVTPTPAHDLNSCSILIYEKPGDRIGWHYDHNFYKGRHFTVLLPLVNTGRNRGLSHAEFHVMIEGKEAIFPSPPGCLIVFEGAKVLHQATPIKEGERRLVVSMTFATDIRAPFWKTWARRIKDVFYYGPSALWRR